MLSNGNLHFSLEIFIPSFPSDVASIPQHSEKLSVSHSADDVNPLKRPASKLPSKLSPPLIFKFGDGEKYGLLSSI